MGVQMEQSPQNMLTRLAPSMVSKFYDAGFWTEASIYSLANQHAAAAGARIAVRDSHCSLSYADLLLLADELAADLASNGLRPGDRVAAWLSNRVEMAVFLLACSRNSYVFSPSLHRNHTVEEIGILLQRMKAKAFVAEEGFGADAAKHDILSKASDLDHVVRVFKLSPPAPRTPVKIRAELNLRSAPASAPVGRADDIVYLAFTSGTTGDPKGVMHSSNTLLANARALASEWEFNSDTVNYTLSPLSHNLGFGALVLTILVGGEIVLHDLPRGASLLARLKETGTTFIYGVPAHAIDLLDEIERAGGASLPRLKGFRISGAAASTTVVEKLLAHGIVPQSGYGMTEAGSHNYTLPTDDPSLVVNTSGRTAPGYELRVFSVDDPDAPVETGTIGHIGGRGASLMLGYFGNQLATESSFNRSGWFMTGDLGRIDENGYLQITGRIKEIIIRGGHNIHPAKIELLAMRHAQVERAAAIPIKDERLGEKVCLVVMPKNGSAIDPNLLLNHLQEEGLSKFDMPEYFAEVAEIPLSASGKMLKRALLPMLEEGKLKPAPIRWRPQA